jgi:hypothetical protein
MDENIEERKQLIIKHKTLNGLKWIVPISRDHLDKFPWQMGWLQHYFHDYDDYKTKEI